jgi:hypothetical protein
MKNITRCFVPTKIVAVYVAFMMVACGDKTLFVTNKTPTQVNDKQFVPFTEDLKVRVEKNGLDIRKVQFYNDQKLVLRRSLGGTKADVKGGVILFENGEYINEIVINAFTPGICEVATADKLSISFEEANKNTIEFGLGGLNSNQYVLFGSKWENGSAEVMYDNEAYRIRCGNGCSNVGDVKLVVKKSEFENTKNNIRVVEGRKIN